MTANLLILTSEKRESPMKRILMPATALAAMKKVAFVVFCVTVLTLVAKPAKADEALDPCHNPTIGTPANVGPYCGVVITITGTSGNLVATITGSGNAYDNDDDQLVGIQNNSSVTVGTIRLFAQPSDDRLFAFDGDGPCFYANPGLWCPQNQVPPVAYPNPPGSQDPNPVGYEGPDNIFVGVSADFTTGTVSFTTPIPPGESTWFALENAPTTVVAIGETKTLT